MGGWLFFQEINYWGIFWCGLLGQCLWHIKIWATLFCHRSEWHTHCVVWSRQNLLIRNWNKLLRLKRGSEVFHDTIAAQMIKLQFIVNYIEQRRLFFSVWYGFQEIFPWETTTSCLMHHPYEFLFGMHYKTGSRKKRNNVNPM